MKTQKIKEYANYVIFLVLIIGILYMVLVTIGIYCNALNCEIEPFHTAYITFYSFDRSLVSLRLSVYLFYVFFVLTLIAPVVVFVKEVKSKRE